MKSQSNVNNFSNVKLANLEISPYLWTEVVQK